MNQHRHVFVITVVSIALVVAAIVAVRQDSSVELLRSHGIGEKVAPKLEQSLNEVAIIEASDGEQTVHIDRSEKGVWTIRELSNYPANIQTIRRLLYRFAASKQLEKKAANPELFPKLWLGDGVARRLKLLKKDTQEPLLDVYVGKRDDMLQGTYLRKQGDTQSWLASEDLSFEASPINWVNTTIVNIDPARLWEVRLEHVGTPPIDIVRTEPGGDFALQQLPVERIAKEPSALLELASVIKNMQIVNVGVGAKVKAAPSIHATFITLDGLELTIDIILGSIQGQHWARMSARYVPEAVLDHRDTKATHKKAEEVQKEVAEISKHTEGWVYMLAPQAVMPLAQTMEDLSDPATKQEPKAQEK